MTTHERLTKSCQQIADTISNPPLITEDDLDYNPDAELGLNDYCEEHFECMKGSW